MKRATEKSFATWSSIWNTLFVLMLVFMLPASINIFVGKNIEAITVGLIGMIPAVIGGLIYNKKELLKTKLKVIERIHMKLLEESLLKNIKFVADGEG